VRNTTIVCPPDVSTLLPIVIRSKAFDDPPKEPCPCVCGDNPSLPHTEDVLKYVGCTNIKEFDAMPLPKPSIAVLRLSHYTEWVTMALSALENKYYGVELEVCQAISLSRSPSLRLLSDLPSVCMCAAFY
jgi:hypothetical protein